MSSDLHGTGGTRYTEDYRNGEPDWFGELGQTLADIVDELKILGHNTKPFARRIEAAMYKAARARSAAEDQSVATGDPSAEVG